MYECTLFICTSFGLRILGVILAVLLADQADIVFCKTVVVVGCISIDDECNRESELHLRTMMAQGHGREKSKAIIWIEMNAQIMKVKYLTLLYNYALGLRSIENSTPVMHLHICHSSHTHTHTHRCIRKNCYIPRYLIPFLLEIWRDLSFFYGQGIRKAYIVVVVAITTI